MSKKLPENCPVCGEKVEEGILRIGGRGILVKWGPPNWRPHSLLGLRIGSGDAEMDMVGLRCPKCKTIVLLYSGKK